MKKLFSRNIFSDAESEKALFPWEHLFVVQENRSWIQKGLWIAQNWKGRSRILSSVPVSTSTRFFTFVYREKQQMMTRSGNTSKILTWGNSRYSECEIAKWNQAWFVIIITPSTQTQHTHTESRHFEVAHTWFVDQKYRITAFTTPHPLPTVRSHPFVTRDFILQAYMKAVLK